ncbi:hypothetical protein BB559_000015 [Furculomyces boomerangus]|uniref:Uncharacterized protein n=1 Tax=Furculomyces boomerangus TaxID=61424 RepID=A0A2T9Z4I9_9FUNG|nr:hypothetical protein BB559_000637 [Furculomyces boomerangus]PVV00213.1 hypothetical protein BB559_000015 [Furculomyces boomerangus]
MSGFPGSDRRLVNGPERSVPPLEPNTDGNIRDSIIQNKRPSGREILQPRPLFIKSDLVNNASGSAYLEQGGIKISCSVYGPRPIKKVGAIVSSTTGNLECEFKFSQFSSSWRKIQQRDSEEKEISQILTQALGPAVCLHMFPKSSIDVFVTVIESDGRSATIAAAIKCASLALADGSIDMYDMVSCCSVSMINGFWIVDSDQKEENEEDASILLAYMPSSQEITHTIQTGKTSIEQTQNGINLCLDACTKLYESMMLSAAY